MFSVLSIEIIIWGGIAFSVALHNTYLLLLVPALLFFYVVQVIKYAELKPATAAQISKARKSVMLAIAVIVLLFWLLSLLLR